MPATAIKSTLDPRLCLGAYVKRDGVLWMVLAKERDEHGSITGMYVLEAALGQRSNVGGGAHVYIHPRVVASATTLTRDYELVREAQAPDLGHLDAEMNEHLRTAGIQT